MTKTEVLGYLKAHKTEFKERFGVIKIGLFGSFARDEQREDSDIDLAIEIEKERKTLKNFFGLQRELEAQFGKRVDLGIENALKPIVKEYVKKRLSMSKRDVKLFVNDIKESIEAIFEYVRDLDFDDFVDDRKTYSAVIREFEIIGEATKHLPNEITEKYSEVGWRDIKDFRNLLIHEYFGVDFEIVWNTIKEDLPPLYDAINKMALSISKR